MGGVSSRFVWFTGIGGLFLVFAFAGLVPLTLSTLAVIVLCGALELLDSSVGMGYGTTLTPVLLLLGFDPVQLVPTILISEFLSGFAATFFHSEAGNVRFFPGSNHLRAAIVLSAFSVVGVAVGVNVAVGVSAVILRRVMGLVILGAGVYILVTSRRTFRFNSFRVVLLALVASFSKSVSGGGYGPLMTSGQIMSGIQGRAAVAITSLAEGFTCLVGSVMFLALGRGLDTALLVPVLTGALLSVPFSARIVRSLREDRLKLVIAVLTIGLGGLTLLKTL